MRKRNLAWLALIAFVLTFVAARVLVILIMSRRIPDLYLHLGGTHIHHLNYGIFLLVGVGAWLLFRRPNEPGMCAAAVLYGCGLALTFDEFGMWIHLGGSYWQRASFDAVVIAAACLSLIALAPAMKRLGRSKESGESRGSRRAIGRWTIFGVTAFVILLAIAFGILLYRSLSDEEAKAIRRLEQLEQSGPR